MASSSRVPIKATSRLERAKDLARKRAISKRSGELKCVDVTVLGEIHRHDTSSPEIVSLLNPIVEGTGFYQRIGEKISLRSLRLRLHLVTYFQSSYSNFGQVTGEMYRFAVVYDSHPTGEYPLFSDIFASAEPTGGQETYLVSCVNPTKTERFRVLRELFVNVNPPVMPRFSSAEEPNWVDVPTLIDEYIDLQELPTVFKGSGVHESGPAEISDIAAGALYLVRACTTTAFNLTYGMLVDSKIRLRYTG